MAVKVDLHNDASEGDDSTGLDIDGALPNTGVFWQSGLPIKVNITYDGANLAVTFNGPYFFDTWTHSFPIDIPSIVGGKTAYVGFTGSTGNSVSTQQILSWTFTNP
jgi:hypothetical protein